MNILPQQVIIDGVQTIVPPSEFKTAIDIAVKKFVGESARDGLYSVATFNNGKIGVNLVVVKNIGKSVKVEGYIGKTWGQPIDGGIQGVWYFD